MATKGTRYITFRDILSGRTPNGFVDKEVVELVAQENPILQDVLWKECNKGNEDIVTIRSGLPEAVVRAYYEGWAGTKSSKRQVSNACCRVSTGIEFDWGLYKADKDKAAFLTDEQRAHSSSLGIKLAGLLVYGDSSEDPKGINGFCKTFGKYGAISGSSMVTDDKVAQFYCMNGGLAAEAGVTAGVARRSIMLVGWGAKSCHGIYPEGTSAGIKIEQLMKQYQQIDGKNVLMGMQEMNWHAGLNIRDFRYCGRIANINVMADPMAAGAVDYTMLVRRLATRVKSEGVTQRLYMPRLVFEAVAMQFEHKTQANAFKYADLEQKKDASLLGIPVSFCDCMNGDEKEVTAA